ncbi:MAG: hypothetical protein JJ896_16070 [Rhodothermales bacterium]|nr:hypothetical protein [Rhodothermales bacterium]MBO6781172.1 hypothetical protein [Rhodothermales bacterium]
MTRGANILGVILACLAGLSCDSGDFDPFDNDRRYFTVFGYLDERDAQHTLRVIPLTRLAENITDPSDPQASIDGVVTSTDLRTGEVTRWNHRLDRLSDGNYGHVFRARFPARAGRSYLLEITRNDGTVTWAETTIPRFPAVRPVPDTLFFPWEVNPDSALTQRVFLPGITSPWDIHLMYDLSGRWVRVPYGRTGRRVDGGWEFTVDLADDAGKMREVMGLPPTAPLAGVHAIELQVRTLAEEWDPPDGEFDPEVLAQPGVLSNVQQGYGLWSGIGSYFHTFIRPPQ